MQDSAHSTRRGRNKVYEYLKKEIDLRDKRKPTKEDKKNQVSFINGEGGGFSFFFCTLAHRVFIGTVLNMNPLKWQEI